MTKRFVLVALAMSVAVAPLSGGCAAGQGQSESQGTWTVPRTADGQPDLEGIWTNATITPFERGTAFVYSGGVASPESAAEREFFTEEEAARFAALALEGRERFGYVARSLDAGTGLLSTRQTSLVVDPPDGLVPIKAWAESDRDHNKMHESDDFLNMTGWDRCISRGVPGSMFPAGYNNAYRFVQTPDTVVILYEVIHDVRIIPVTDQPHIDADIRQWMGDARARWEDDTLVVTTTNFNDKGMISTSSAGARLKGIPVSNAHEVVERFTRLSEDELLWEMTVEDPEVYDRPWTVSMPLTRDPDYVMYEYACHEGNRALPLLLRGARIQPSSGG